MDHYSTRTSKYSCTQNSTRKPGGVSPGSTLTGHSRTHLPLCASGMSTQGCPLQVLLDEQVCFCLPLLALQTRRSDHKDVFSTHLVVREGEYALVCCHFLYVLQVVDVVAVDTEDAQVILPNTCNGKIKQLWSVEMQCEARTVSVVVFKLTDRCTHICEISRPADCMCQAGICFCGKLLPNFLCSRRLLVFAEKLVGCA